MIDANRLDSSSVSADGSVINEPNAIVVSTGSAVGVAGHHLAPQHPAYGFTYSQTPTALFPHGAHFAPVYILPDGSFLHPYHSPFPPSTAPAHISQLPAAAAHHPSVISSGGGNIEQPPNEQLVPSAPPSTTSTTHSSISASPPSIPAAYHNSLNSSTSETPTYDDSCQHNESYLPYSPETANEPICNKTAANREVEIASAEPVPSETEIKPSLGDSTTVLDDQEKSNSSVQSLFCKFKSLNISNETKQSDKSEKPVDDSQVSSEHFGVAQKIEPNPTEPQESNSSCDNAPSSSQSNNSSEPSNKTWASLFEPKTSSNEAAVQNQKASTSSTVDSKSDFATGDSESKSSQFSNGEFPELNTSKTTSLVIQNSRKSRYSNIIDTEDGVKTTIPMKSDQIALKLAKRLRDSIHLKHSLPTIMPCGLINRGNWCYINAV